MKNSRQNIVTKGDNILPAVFPSTIPNSLVNDELASASVTSSAAVLLVA